MHDYKLKTSPKITLLWVKYHARNLAAGLLANSRVTKSDIVHVRLVEGFIQKPFLIAPFAEKLKELLEGK